MLWCILNIKAQTGWRLKDGKTYAIKKCKHKKDDVATLKSDKVDFKRKSITKDKDYHFIIIKLGYNSPKYQGT